MAARENAYHGIVTIYKEAGFTSFDVVAKLRGIFGQRKIGHTGTLDPDATGVLPVCLGSATKVCDLLADGEKEYVAALLLGMRTDTQDTSGQILGTPDEQAAQRAAACGLGETQIRDAAASFLGDYEQIPPMYSAKKINGQKLYDLARKGIEVERQACKVHISELEILGMSSMNGTDSASGSETLEMPVHIGPVREEEIGLPLVYLRVVCSKGTYIRTLCEDIGQKLGCGGCMQSLRRTQVGPFLIAQALTLEQIQDRKNAGDNLQSLLQSVDSLFPNYMKVQVLPAFAKSLENGNKLSKEQFFLCSNSVTEHSQMCCVYHPDGSFAGVYEWESPKMIKPVKLFFAR